MKVTTIFLTISSCFISFNTNASHSLSSAGDPFIKTWLYNNGVIIYPLTISLSDAPGSHYRVTYRTPEETYQSDVCNANSSNTIQCYDGTSFMRDDEHHVITISSHRDLKYYDPEYLPRLPAIVGTWTYSFTEKNINYSATIVVRQGKNDNQVEVFTDFTNSNGYQCDWPYYDTYNVTTNTNGTQRYTMSSDKGFIYDPVKNVLTRLPNDYYPKFVVGMCIDFQDMRFSAQVNAEFKKS